MSFLDTVIGRIEASEALGQAATPVHRLAVKVAGSGRWRNLLSGVGLGHPGHPALVGVPAGAWTSALIMDATGRPAAADSLVGLGTVSVLPAVLSGLSDWADTEGAEQRVGLVHLSLNLAATAAYAGSWMLRRHGSRRAGVGLSLVGAVTVSAAAWFGGHLAYAAGVGVDTNAFRTGPTEWTDIGPLPADGSVERREADGVGVVVTVRSSEVTVLADRCSHRGGPLSDSGVSGGCLTCPWHGSRFDAATGAVEQGPATVPQPVYATRVTAGRLEIRRHERRALRTNVIR